MRQENDVIRLSELLLRSFDSGLRFRASRQNVAPASARLTSGYGKSIQLHRGDSLVVHQSRDARVVILEYEVHGKILRTGVSYDNRFVSIITIENRRIVHWRDYMDSLTAWTALNIAS
jgi:ketosteroid isomerase-like protein